jgi:hypothetical protein
MSLPEVPDLSTLQPGSGPIRGWDESVRRPEDGKLVAENLNSSLPGNSLISPFSLFNLVQFPNLECPADTGSIFYHCFYQCSRDPVSDRIWGSGFRRRANMAKKKDTNSEKYRFSCFEY